MTGTAKTEEEEFKQIYKLKVIQVPTNKPVIRKDLPDVIYMTEKAKYKAISNKIKELYDKGQPVLVGTASIEQSEKISQLLKKQGSPHNKLNAKHHGREAEIIAQAGRFKSVTIATNMAGRGTDIKLGGEPEALAEKEAEKGTPEYEIALAKYEKDCEENRNKVLEVGGLFVLGTERHESRRIDNQLRGRSGRQGDPGTSEFYLALDDHLMIMFGGDKLQSMMRVLKMDEDEEIRHRQVTKGVENAQKRIESRNFSSRKSLLEYDDVNNNQREVIYKQRDLILGEDDLKPLVYDMLEDTVSDIADMALTGDRNVWDFNLLADRLKEVFEYELPEIDESKDRDEIVDMISKDLIASYNEKRELIGEEQFKVIEKYIMLEVLDSKWRQHLADLNELREGIGLRGYAQRSPAHDYKIVGYEIYNEMIDAIKRETTGFLSKLRIQKPEETTNLKHEEMTNVSYQHEDVTEFEEQGDEQFIEESNGRSLSRR